MTERNVDFDRDLKNYHTPRLGATGFTRLACGLLPLFIPRNPTTFKPTAESSDNRPMNNTVPKTTRTTTGNGAPSPATSDQRLATSADFTELDQLLQESEPVDYRRLAKLLNHTIVEGNVSLIQIFMAARLIRADELQKAKTHKKNNTNTPLVTILRQLGFLGDRTMALGLAVASRLPYLECKPALAEAGAIRHLDGKNAALWQALPLRVREDGLLLAVADPKAVDTVKAETLAGIPIHLCISPGNMVRYAIDYWYGGEATEETPQEIGQLDLRELTPEDFGSHLMDYEGSAMQLVDQIILNAVHKRASDIHIKPDSRFVHIYFRLDGKLHEQAKIPLSFRSALISRIKVVAGMDIAERRLPQDGNIQARLSDRMFDIRVSNVPTVQGETLVLRILDQQVGMVRLADLGFFQDDLHRLRRAISLPYGLILVTGPTGSGKSTTLRAALDHIVHHDFCHVLTVEDPVEVKMEQISQVQVNNKTGYTFPRALRHFLRHDPDVIMVGEIRDEETAKIAVQAALTGHMVISTLHTNDAPSAITRLLDMDVEPYLVSSAVTLVIAQRLVRRLCKRCRRPYRPEERDRHLLRVMGHDDTEVTLHDRSGCPACNETGFNGRTVVYEMLAVDEGMKQRIAHREPAAALRRLAMEKNFQPLTATALKKVLDGETALSEVTGYIDTFADLR